MAVEVLVPQMGESVLEGTILEWKVKVGDKVTVNQPLVELMTDKVNIEIPSEVNGVITELLVKENDVVPVGTRIAIIDDGSGKDVKAIDKKVEPIAQKAQAPVPAPATTTSAVTTQSKSDVKATAAVGLGKMSPKVKMLVREYSIDSSAITPTGVEGRVTVDDVMRAVEGRSTQAGFKQGPIPAPPTPMMSAGKAAVAPAATTALSEPKVKVEIPKFEPLPQAQREKTQPVEGVRKLISEHMLKSVSISPHVTTFEDIDLTDLVAFRKQIKNDFVASYGANITYMPFVVKAVCLGLKEFPKMNATMTNELITYKYYYNIGIAVAREEGLIVPVIKDADKKTIVELAVEIAQLGEKARTNRLLPDDVSGGTFSLTNAGVFGAAASTPIINQPQVAILGIHAIQKKAWVHKGEIAIRDISSFGLSFDHRLIDGHVAVQFLHRVHEYLADVKKFMLNLR
ncbi:MAG: dihydrolipoamide acetyltransferase family protein [bacterium]